VRRESGIGERTNISLEINTEHTCRTELQQRIQLVFDKATKAIQSSPQMVREQLHIHMEKQKSSQKLMWTQILHTSQKLKIDLNHKVQNHKTPRSKHRRTSRWPWVW
jgi:hypothetical protein